MRSLLIVLILCFYLTGNSQTGCECPTEKEIKSKVSAISNLDSLERSFNRSKGESDVPCDLVLTISSAELILGSSPDKAIKLLSSKVGSVEESCSGNLKAEFYLVMGRAYSKSGNFDSAVVLLLKAYDLTKNENGSLFVKVITQLANSYYRMENAEKAIYYYTSAGEISRKNGDDFQAAKLYGNLASAYGMKYSKKAVPDLLDISLLYLDLSSRLARISNNKLQVQFNYGTYAGIYELKGALSLSLKYCDSVLIQRDINPINKAIVFSRMSHINVRLKNMPLALRLADSSYRCAVSAGMPAGEIIASLNQLAKCHKLLANHDRHAKLLERIIEYKDSVNLSETSSRIEELEKKYNQVKNEKTISDLNQRKEVDSLRIRSLVALSAFILMGLIVIGFLYRQSVVRNRMKVIETEQRLNRSRMNPHFFFNGLSSLQNFSLSDTKKDLVPGLISRFSKIMRQSLESTFHEMDSIENETIFLTDYLELQNVLAENNFEYQFIIDEEIEVSDVLIPGMILQPFIENAIEHAFNDLGYMGFLEIEFKVEGESLKVFVRDNGKGYKTDPGQKTYPSRATGIVLDRLFLLNTQYKTNATFVINTLSNGGTEIALDLPLLYKK